MVFCKNCGADLNPAAKFCAKCGTPAVPLEGGTSQAQTEYTQEQSTYNQDFQQNASTEQQFGQGGSEQGYTAPGADMLYQMPSRADLKAAAKESLKGNWGTAIGTLLVGSLILSIASGVTFGLAGIVLTGVIEVGFAFVFLNIIRTKSGNFNDLFAGFNNFGTTCLSGIFVALFAFLWSLLFIIPGIIKAFAYSMTFFIIKDDPNISALDAITASRKMMAGHKGELFVLALSFIGWILLSGLTFGLLMFYVGPYMYTTLAAYYDSLRKLQRTA